MYGANTTSFYFATESKEVLPLGSAHCSKIFVDVPMNMALSKKRKEKSYELK
jgi:hypothetical protein